MNRTDSSPPSTHIHPLFCHSEGVCPRQTTEESLPSSTAHFPFSQRSQRSKHPVSFRNAFILRFPISPILRFTPSPFPRFSLSLPNAPNDLNDLNALFLSKSEIRNAFIHPVTVSPFHPLPVSPILPCHSEGVCPRQTTEESLSKRSTRPVSFRNSNSEMPLFSVSPSLHFSVSPFSHFSPSPFHPFSVSPFLPLLFPLCPPPQADKESPDEIASLSNEKFCLYFIIG